MQSKSPPKAPTYNAMAKTTTSANNQNTQYNIATNKDVSGYNVDQSKDLAAYNTGQSQNFSQWQTDQNKSLADYLMGKNADITAGNTTANKELATWLAGQNANIATQNQERSMVGQDTPYGSLTWSQVGTYPDGTPKYQASTKLSDQQQGLLDQRTAVGGAMNEAGKTWADFIGGMDPNFDLSSTAIDKTIMDRYQPRFDEQRARELDQLNTSLANKGIRQGSEAYSRAMADYNKSSGDTYNQLQIQARDEAIKEMTQQRSTPFSEMQTINSMGMGPTGPTFVNTPTSSQPSMSVPFAQNPNVSMPWNSAQSFAASDASVPYASSPYQDTSQMMMDAYKNGPLAQYQSDEAQRQAMMSAMFQLGGTAIGAVAGGPMGASIGGSLGGTASKWINPDTGFGTGY